MSGESVPPDLDAPPVRPSLPGLCQALDSLRQRLNRLERVLSQSASPAGAVIAGPAADGDPLALAIAQEILSIPSSGLDPGELFTLAMDRASRLLAADRTMLFVGEPGGGRLVPRSAHGFRREDLESISVPPGEGIVGGVFKERRVLTYTAGGEGDAAPDSFIKRFPVQAAIAVPVRAEDEVAGVLYAGRRRLGAPFSANEVLLLLVIADRVGGGLVHQALLEGARSGHERVVQIEKARVLGEMARGLARELNNIFAIILGKSRLLLARAHDEPLRESLGLLEEAAWRGADVVDRLTALAGPASGEAVGLVDMAALVHDALAVARPRWKDAPEGRAARIDIVTDLRGAPLVQANAVALRDAFVNIVLNAVDAMPQGGRLSLATRPREAGVEIIIEDTGEGISEDARRRVFDPFFTTRAARRMGLGLTVAHGVITRYGGGIEISSDPGRGTRVMVWFPGAEIALAAPSAGRGTSGIGGAVARELPAPGKDDVVTHGGAGTSAATSPPPPPVDADQPADVKEGRPRAGEGPEPTGEAASILVLEDEASVRSLLVAALVQAGHKVETAVDGPSGLAKLDSGHYDVVLTDLALPQRSGLAIARSVKRLSPRTPVVLITGWGHLLDPERLREHGVDLMLVKPFRLERVLSVVGAALRLRSSA